MYHAGTGNFNYKISDIKLVGEASTKDKINGKDISQNVFIVDIEIIEEHFKGKKEASGTAKILAKNLDVESTEIKSVRAGGIVGKHEIIFGFPFQTVRLVHESISREAFGNGVIFVAQNLINKDKGLYNFEQILEPYFNL